MSFGYGAVGGPEGIGIGHVGITSFVLLALYLIGQVVLFRLAKSTYKSNKKKERPTGMAHWPLGWVLASYAALVGIIVVAAYNLGVSAEGIASWYGLGATFAGATLLGVVTSLPEVANALTCAKRKEYDLVVGNILGANVFVFVVIFLADLFTREGRLFNLLRPIEAFSSVSMAGLAIAMQAVVLCALAVRSVDRIWKLSIPSILLAFFYVASLVIAYHFASP